MQFIDKETRQSIVDKMSDAEKTNWNIAVMNYNSDYPTIMMIILLFWLGGVFFITKVYQDYYLFFGLVCGIFSVLFLVGYILEKRMERKHLDEILIKKSKEQDEQRR